MDLHAFFVKYPTLLQLLKLLLSGVVALVAVRVALRLENRLMKRIAIGKRNINLRFVESIGRFVVIMLAVQWVIMSSPLTQPFGRVLFQGTAIIGAIAGFAAQPVIADMICGLMISATRPFNIGDRVELEDGTAGIVKDITMRHVVIETVDTVEVILPNSKLNSMKITNMSYHTSVRSVRLRYNVGYGCDTNQAMEVIGRAVRECPLTIPGRPDGSGKADYAPVYFEALGESSLVMSTTVYFEPAHSSAAVRSDVNARVKQALNQAGIEIPYNYVNVVLRDEGADGR